MRNAALANVLVDGTFALRDGTHTRLLPGLPIRRGGQPVRLAAGAAQ